MEDFKEIVTWVAVGLFFVLVVITILTLLEVI